MDIKQEVENVINDFVAQFKMFTAYDVTKMVRHRASQLGLTDRFSHYGKDGVRDIVGELFRDGSMGNDYDHTLISIDSQKNITAIVYHDVSDSPSVYDSVWVEREISQSIPAPVAAPTPIKVPIAAPVSPFVANSNNGCIVTTDQRGRACVLNSIVRAAGGNIGDWFYATYTPGKLVLTLGVSCDDSLPHYVVDKSSNIRVSAYVLNKANIYADNVTISVDSKNSTITLT